MWHKSTEVSKYIDIFDNKRDIDESDYDTDTSSLSFWLIDVNVVYRMKT
jgi:hypothetical protein